MCDSMRATLTRERRRTAGLVGEKAGLEKQIAGFHEQRAAYEREVCGPWGGQGLGHADELMILVLGSRS